MVRLKARKKKGKAIRRQNSTTAVGEAYQTLKNVRFFRILGLTVIVLAISSAGIYLVEYRGGKAIGVWDSLWWALVTITTVGYGDIVPETVVGRLIAFSIMISGLILVSLMTATIASLFVTRKIKEGKGLEDIKVRDHIIICGWNENGLSVIEGLFRQLTPHLPTIVLVNNLPREEVDAVIYRFPKIEFKYVRGNFINEEILARANLIRARSAIILADTAGGFPAEKADERTIFGCMAIKSLAPKVKTCAELISRENREHLSRAKVDEIFVRGEHGPAILAGGAVTTGLSTVMKGLLDFEEANKLWRADIPDHFVGLTVAELSGFFMDHFGAILLALFTESEAIQLDDILSNDASAIDGFIKRKFEEAGKDYFSSKERIAVRINPPRDYVLTENEVAIVLGRQRPTAASFLEKSLELVKGSKRAEEK